MPQETYKTFGRTLVPRDSGIGLRTTRIAHLILAVLMLEDQARWNTLHPEGATLLGLSCAFLLIARGNLRCTLQTLCQRDRLLDETVDATLRIPAKHRSSFEERAHMFVRPGCERSRLGPRRFLLPFACDRP